MADGYSPYLLLIEPETGVNLNVWGTKLNVNAIRRIDEAIVGVSSYALTAPKTLTRNNGLADESRMRVQNVTGITGTGGTVTIAASPLWHIWRNGDATDDLTVTNGSNSLAIKPGNVEIVASDGTNIWRVRTLDYGADLLLSTGAPTLGAHLTNKDYVDAAIIAAALSSDLPGQAGNAGKFIRTDGTTATWTALTDNPLDRPLVGATPAAGAGGYASYRLPHGAAPTTNLQNGDMWSTAAGLFFRANGVTYGPFSSSSVQEFLASGNWTKPSGCTFVIVEVVGGGGGGASGRRGASGSYRGGGGGGGGGGYAYRFFLASSLAASEAVTIGAGGVGGAAVTVDDTSGNNGSPGGATSFSSGATIVTAGGGAGGVGGAGSAVTGGAGGSSWADGSATPASTTPGDFLAAGATSSTADNRKGFFGGASGGAGKDAADIATTGAPSYWGGGSGAAGGGISAANTVQTTGNSATGGDGNTAAGVLNGNGTAGTGRCGGAGGAAQNSGTAGKNGGAGGTGSGGGGGGASYNASNSGAGAVGGSGRVRVYAF